MFRVTNPARGSRGKGFVSGVALALALTAVGAGFAAPAQAQSDKPAYSKNFGKPAQKASEDLNAARNKPEILAEINNLVAASNALSTAKGDAVASAQAQFDAVAKRIQGMTTAERQEIDDLATKAESPDDKYFTGELMNFLGTFTGDSDLRAKGIRLKLASGVLKPEAVAPAWMEVGQIDFGSHRTDQARAEFDSAYKAGDMQGALYATETYYSANRVPEGLDYLESLITARTVAGQAVPQEWYGDGLNQARTLGDSVRIGHWAALYASRGNTPQSWNAAIALVMQAGKFGPAEQLDGYRLMKRTGSLVSAGDYVHYVEAADARSMGNEVLPVLNEAISKGLLSQTAGGTVTADLASFTQTNFDTATRRGAEDRAQIGTIVADARKGANGEGARDAGDVYQTLGESAKAEEMFQLALQKGGIDNDRVLMRLAIVQADQGKYPEARASFAKVGGIRAPLAAMWLAYLDTKAPRA